MNSRTPPGLSSLPFVFLCCLFISSSAGANLTNAWTKATSGNWDEPVWSLGELPSSNQAAIMVTNAGFKAVAVNYATTINHPGSLQIQNLTVDSPVNSANLLLLNYSGSITPLTVLHDFTIGSRGSLLSYSSALNAERLFAYGKATFAENSLVDLFELNIGGLGDGLVVLSNGWMHVTNIQIVPIVAGGAFKQYGGTNDAGSIRIVFGGSYDLFGGDLKATQSATIADQNSRLTVVGGALHVDSGLWIGGFTNSSFGTGGQVLLNGGSVAADFIHLLTGSFDQTGGTAVVGRIELTMDQVHSLATLSGGTLVSGEVSLGAGNRGDGTMIQSGGLHRNTNGITIFGLPSSGGSSVSGRYNLTRGRLESSGLTVSGGGFNQSNATNIVGDIAVSFNGNMKLESGLVQANNVSVQLGYNPEHPPEPGITQSGGSFQIGKDLTLFQGGPYNLQAGYLSSSNVSIYGGKMMQGGGINQAQHLRLDLSGLFALSGGTLSNLDCSIHSGGATDRNTLSWFVQSSGTHLVQTSLVVDGVYQLAGGNLVAPALFIDVDGELRLEGGNLNNAVNLTMTHGRFFAQGQHNNLGKLRVIATSALSHLPDDPPFSTLNLWAGSARLHFQDSHDVAGDWTGTLWITNWSGSVSGGGTDQVFFGASAQGLGGSQLNRIVFADPQGLPAGIYPAAILSTGEVVPASRPVLTFTHSAQSMVISWSGAYDLWSATNVIGPYTLVAGASSPYTNSFSEPQRFFQLRSRAP